jgi:hypothetical protein
MPLNGLNNSSSPDLELSEQPSQAPHQRLPGEEDTDDISTASSYEYESANDLNMWQGAALLTADCLGTGLLALPQDIHVLGRVIGIGFLIVNLPINLFSGTILSRAADHVEEEQSQSEDPIDVDFDDTCTESNVVATTVHRDGLVRVVKKQKQTTYSSIFSSDPSNESTDDSSDLSSQQGQPQHVEHPHHPHDSATLDYIGLTHKLFPNGTHASQIVMMIFYTNIFLVLGK